jgi:hypothetical protein
MKTTVEEFAKTQNISKAYASQVLAFLCHKGVAKVVEVVRKEGQLKGKGKNVFEVAETVTLDMTKAE